MEKITITEALAEIPTITKRINKKQEFIFSYLYRQSSVRDPHEKDGGAQLLISREIQAIDDLQERIVNIRAAIQKSNQVNTITIGNTTRTIADWLTWRREVAPVQQVFLNTIVGRLNAVRQDAQRKGMSVIGEDKGYSSNDIIVNISEKGLADSIEEFEQVMGFLDGQLSLKNATILIDL